MFVRTIALTGLALIAFAANSVLCRLALGKDLVDASSFTIIRLLSGAIVLLAIVTFKRSHAGSSSKGSWMASLMLFTYAITFSFAYISLDTGTGALILFGSVQISMLVLSVISGNRLHVTEWAGVIMAFTGFVLLVLPAVSTPDIYGFLLMSVAGTAWGIYTLKGRDSKSPLMDTAYNFIRTVPFVLLVFIFSINSINISSHGVILAMLSGGIASAIGYSIWYAALAGLSATQAAVLQLLVPVIAALGGVIFVSEMITMRLVISSIMILGGILVVVLGRNYFVRSNQEQ